MRKKGKRSVYGKLRRLRGKVKFSLSVEELKYDREECIRIRVRKS